MAVGYMYICTVYSMFSCNVTYIRFQRRLCIEPVCSCCWQIGLGIAQFLVVISASVLIGIIVGVLAAAITKYSEPVHGRQVWIVLCACVCVCVCMYMCLAASQPVTPCVRSKCIWACQHVCSYAQYVLACVAYTYVHTYVQAVFMYACVHCYDQGVMYCCTSMYTQCTCKALVSVHEYNCA